MTTGRRILAHILLGSAMLAQADRRLDGAGQPAGGPVTHQQALQEQQALLTLFGQLPRDKQLLIMGQASREGIDLAQLLQVSQQGRILSAAADDSVQRGIKEELKPIPIVRGRFVEVYRNRTTDVAAIPTGDEAARLLRQSASVGRVERLDTHRLVGTAFVVAPGVLATNCHVLKEMSRLLNASEPLPSDQTVRSYVIDFGDSADHDESLEFDLDGIAGYPAAPFLDVALLNVKATSRRASRALPAPLTLRQDTLAPLSPAIRRRVELIGYPDLGSLVGDRLTLDLFRAIRESGPDNVKLASPGEIVGIDASDGLDFLDHVASTHPGQSGSPVIDRITGDVVGVHFCCSFPGKPATTDPLACSSQRVSDRVNNEAVSTWSAADDPALKRWLSRQR